MKAGARKVIVRGLSDIGIVRDENEDSLAIREPEDVAVRKDKGILVALADGMGGLADGATASRLAVEKIVEAYYRGREPPGLALERAVKEANREIFLRSRSSATSASMGSTVTALALLEGQAWVGQVGDSRAYCYRDGTLHQITRDHSLVRELVDMGQIEESSPHYAFHRNVLTRGLGLREDVAVDIYELRELEPGDRIVLSSDGLHEIVNQQEMVVALEKFGTDLDGACREMVGIATSRGAPDNITVAIVCITTEDGSLGDARAPSSRRETLVLGLEKPRFEAGWLLPLAVFLAFAAGVFLTLFVQAPPPLPPDAVKRLEAEVGSALDPASQPPGDVERAARLRASLERIRGILAK